MTHQITEEDFDKLVDQGVDKRDDDQWTVGMISRFLLEELGEAGYEIVKKHPHKTAIAVNEDWGVKHTRNGESKWLQDIHGFPALFSEEKAKGMCISSEYTAHRLRLVAYELNFDNQT